MTPATFYQVFNRATCWCKIMLVSLVFFFNLTSKTLQKHVNVVYGGIFMHSFWNHDNSRNQKLFKRTPATYCQVLIGATTLKKAANFICDCTSWPAQLPKQIGITSTTFLCLKTKSPQIHGSFYKNISKKAKHTLYFRILNQYKNSPAIFCWLSVVI